MLWAFDLIDQPQKIRRQMHAVCNDLHIHFIDEKRGLHHTALPVRPVAVQHRTAGIQMRYAVKPASKSLVHLCGGGVGMADAGHNAPLMQTLAQL